MELNISHLAQDVEALIDYSASRAEGYTGEETWNNAMGHFDDNEPLVSSKEDVQEVKDFFAEFGAWSKEEIATWSTQEVNALLLQFIAGDLRSGDDTGRIYQDDDGQTYFYVGN